MGSGLSLVIHGLFFQVDDPSPKLTQEHHPIDEPKVYQVDDPYDYPITNRFLKCYDASPKVPLPKPTLARPWPGQTVQARRFISGKMSQIARFASLETDFPPVPFVGGWESCRKFGAFFWGGRGSCPLVMLQQKR